VHEVLGVAEDRGEIVGGLDLDRDLGGEGRARARGETVEDLNGGRRLQRDDVVLPEAQQLVGELAPAARGLEDLIELLGDACRARIFAQQRGVGEDAAEQVVELVGEAARQAGHRVDALLLDAVPLERPVLGQVPEDRLDHRSLRRIDARERDVHVHRAPVDGAEPLRELAQRAPHRGGVLPAHADVADARCVRIKFAESASQDAVPGSAEQVREAGVGLEDGPRLV